MRRFIKKNGLERVFLFGFHPMKDWILVGSGIGNDCRYLTLIDFYSYYREELEDE